MAQIHGFSAVLNIGLEFPSRLPYNNIVVDGVRRVP